MLTKKIDCVFLVVSSSKKTFSSILICLFSNSVILSKILYSYFPRDLKILLNFFNKNLFIISFIAQLNLRGYFKKWNKSMEVLQILEKNKLINQIE